MNDEVGNLPRHPNPCCGHVTDSSAELGRMDAPEMPDVGDIAICLNCGALLVYTDPERNVTRYARRSEIETLPQKAKHTIAVSQKFIRKRGWISREAKRRDGN